MTTVSMNTSPDMTSDTTFRAWGGAISTAMASIGWVKVSDSSQINWATVTKPTVANTVAGYEVWGMNDSLQSTAPFFLKIEYGCAASTTFPSMWITIGTAQNGSGTLTGNVGTRKQISLSGSTTLFASKFSGTSSRLTAALWWASANVSYMTPILVERTHDATGGDTDAGCMVFLTNSAIGIYYSQLITSTGTVPNAYTSAFLSCAAPPSGSGTLGSNVYLYPCRVWGPGEVSPFLGCAGYFTADIATGSTVTVTTWDGVNRTMSIIAGFAGFNFGGALNMAVLYE